MQIQRIGRGSAYNNIQWGKGVDTKVDEIAEDYTSRVTRNLKADKDANDALLKAAGEVQARDSEESHSLVLKSRDVISDAAKKYGANSSQFQTVLFNVANDQIRMKQQSTAFGEGMKKADEIKKNPYIKQAEFTRLVNEELKKPLAERNNNIAEELLVNPAVFNAETATMDIIKALAPEVSNDTFVDNEDFARVDTVTHNPMFGSFGKDGSWTPKISDDLVRSVISANPKLYENLFIANDPNGAILMKDKGAGEGFKNEHLREYISGYISSVQNTDPRVEKGEPKIKRLAYNPNNTSSGQTKIDRNKSIDALTSEAWSILKGGKGGELSMLNVFGKAMGGDGITFSVDKGELIMTKPPETIIDEPTVTKMGKVRNQAELRTRIATIYDTSQPDLSGGAPVEPTGDTKAAANTAIQGLFKKKK